MGRFTGVDALAEQALSCSPYQFGYNNPAMFNDPSGLQADVKEGQYWDFWLQILGYIGHPDYPYGITFERNKNGNLVGTANESEADAFLDGINLIERTGGWGKAGVRYKSYAEAVNAFSTKFGYLPPITVKAHKEWDIYRQSWLVIDNWSQVYKQLERNGFRKSPGMLDWDGALFRYLVPDFVSIGGGFAGIVVTGAGSSAELQWVLHGPQASWKPMVTVTQSVGGGYSVDATINIGTSRYTGNASDISRQMVQTDTFGDGSIPTIWGSFGPAVGGKIGGTGSVTYLGQNAFILSGQINLGAGLPAGVLPVNGAGGVSNTFLIHDFK